MKVWCIPLACLVVTLSGACGATDNDRQIASTKDERLDGNRDIPQLTQQTDISSRDILGENCRVNYGCTWEKLPTPEYPNILDTTEASCSVQLTVGDNGLARDVVVECDDRRFDAVTERAILSMKHSVNDACGSPCSIIGKRIDYPIEYRLED